MNTNKFTHKLQEALREAQHQALRHKHGDVDGEHLLLALLEQEEGVLPRIVRRMDRADERLRPALMHSLDRRPRVSGQGVEIYVTRRLQDALRRAEEEAAGLKDEYVAVEYCALAFIAEG